VRPGERALAPDLARGGLLLLIVLSNTGFHLWAASHGASGWHPVGGSALDRAMQLLMITVLDLRVYPLFAFLFGYGMMQLFLRRRSLWLIAFGAGTSACWDRPRPSPPPWSTPPARTTRWPPPAPGSVPGCS
jgi:uncharacterized membrane protein YeiB